MDYLKQFEEKIKKNDYKGFLQLWEEYCYNEQVNYDELKKILMEAKKSDLVQDFGQHVNRAIFLWEKLQNLNQKHEILKLIADIQNKNDEDLAELIYQHLKSKYHDDPLFNEKIRLIGLRAREHFQGAISKYELLSHIKKGKFVFHTAGWGTGEILDISLLREEMILEFEYVVGHKSLSFENALKTLIPLPDNHFLSRRFGNPDLLENQAKENPAEIIKLLLKDLGAKTAAEIKEYICDYIIPAEEWNKWWQNARIKIKKDRKIEIPKIQNDLFILREKEIKHEIILQEKLENKPKPKEIIQMIYSFLKDFPETIKNEDFKNSLIIKLLDVLSFETLLESEKLQIHFFLEILKAQKESIKIEEIIKNCPNLDELLEGIEIINLKKRTLVAIRKYKENWPEIFLKLFFMIDQNILRDYLLAELTKNKTSQLKKKIHELLIHPLIYPSHYIWYFQKVFFTKDKKELFFSDKEGQNQFFEGFLILLDHLENKAAYKELTKKMLNIISANRYELIRKIMQNANIDQVKEYLLLATKCRLLSDHEIKIIHSLAKVAHPNLGDYREKEETDVIWITQEGLNKLKNRLYQLSSVEMIDNAKEIEEARALGDLKENAEYKAALERRQRIQSEIKSLSEQLNKVKLIVKQEVSTDKADIGTIIECKNKKGEKKTFTILGPFEADPEKTILSFQSNLAKNIIGKTIGEKFIFDKNEYIIIDIRNFFD
jgi:transcription elongation factor GreA-like protein/transcription elongation GreA/GreB family factor